MATFDQLSADQRAIVELVLRQGKSYGELAGLLGMTEQRVRELARDALVALSPLTARRVEEDWRGQLADYVLGQQAGPEATATRGHLRRSETARSWARSLLDSLETIYEEDLPAIPEAGRERRPRERDRERRRREEPEEERPPRRVAPEAQAALRRRRRLAGAALAAAVVLVAVLLWPIGVLTGGDDEGDSETAANQPTAGRRGTLAGIAIIAERDGKRQVVVQAAGLPPTRRREAYEVWLYNSPTDARSLGAQVTDQRGTFQGAGPLPTDFARFKFIDVSREPIDQNRRHSGKSVLRGKFGKLRPARETKKGQASVLGQVLLTPPSD